MVHDTIDVRSPVNERYVNGKSKGNASSPSDSWFSLWFSLLMSVGATTPIDLTSTNTPPDLALKIERAVVDIVGGNFCGQPNR
jgi:hypothetical protein